MVRFLLALVVVVSPVVASAQSTEWERTGRAAALAWEHTMLDTMPDLSQVRLDVVLPAQQLPTEPAPPAAHGDISKGTGQADYFALALKATAPNVTADTAAIMAARLAALHDALAQACTLAGQKGGK